MVVFTTGGRFTFEGVRVFITGGFTTVRGVSPQLTCRRISSVRSQIDTIYKTDHIFRVAHGIMLQNETRALWTSQPKRFQHFIVSNFFIFRSSAVHYTG